MTRPELRDPFAPRIEISRGALHHNVQALRRHLPPRVELAAVLKGNAYGHGRDTVASMLAGEVDWLAAAEPVDALALAETGARVLCLGPARGELLGACAQAGVRCAIDDLDMVGGLPRGALVHILVDTGLHRLGAQPCEVDQLRRAITARGARVEGLMCMATGTETGEWPLVERDVALMRSLAAPGELIHTGGTAVAIDRPDLAGDIARSGLAILGYPSAAGQRRIIDLRPSLALIAPVLEVRRVAKGDRVGYDGVPVARDTVVATLPVGVAHGLHPMADKPLGAHLRGRLCPFITRPTLEYALIDATEIGPPEVGEEALVLGGHPDDGTSVEAIASQLDLIVDHILAPLSALLPRFSVA